jgi:mRNA interferase MazF
VKKRRAYLPERGDCVWITFNPVQGHEQTGRRPALVLSPRSYNRKTGLCVVCPATRHKKGYAFEVSYAPTKNEPSVILADHVRCLDWRVRQVQLIDHVPAEVLDEVVAKLEGLIIAPDV